MFLPFLSILLSLPLFRLDVCGWTFSVLLDIAFMVGGGCMYNVHCTIGLGVPRTLKSPKIRHLFLMPLTPKTIDLVHLVIAYPSRNEEEKKL